LKMFRSSLAITFYFLGEEPYVSSTKIPEKSASPLLPRSCAYASFEFPDIGKIISVILV